MYKTKFEQESYKINIKICIFIIKKAKGVYGTDMITKAQVTATFMAYQSGKWDLPTYQI